MPESRRHIAVMFTDIVGYTVLMGSDEDKAVEMLQKNRQIHKQLIKKFHGKLIKEMGDGILISFDLASAAVRCAQAIQTEAIKQHIPLKIGIHEGEMVLEGSDVLGDGVNVASRLQEISEEGCITISGKVYSEIRNKPGIKVEFLKEEVLKNVEEPIKVYRVQLQELVVEESEKKSYNSSKPKLPYYLIVGIIVILIAVVVWQMLPARKNTPATEKSEKAMLDKSIAVLPLDDISPEGDQQWFSDGVMGAILNHLSLIEGLKVISKTTALQYRDTEKTSPEIAQELGVSYILEGDVQLYQGIIRITLQLIDAANDDHLWAESYDRPFENIFALQSVIAKEIAEVLQIQISDKTVAGMDEIPTKSTEAYELFLKANVPQGHFTKRLELLDQAIALDSNYADAYAFKAYCWLAFAGAWAGSESPQIVISNALPLLNKALDINPDNVLAHMNLGALQLWYFWNFEEAEKQYLAALEVNPAGGGVNARYIELLLASGRFQEALDLVQRAIDLGSMTKNWMPLVLYYNGQRHKAERILDSLMAKSIPSGGYDALIYLFLKRYADVVHQVERWQTFRELGWEDTPPRFVGCAAIAYFKLGQLDKANEILDILAEKESKSPVGSPSYYSAMIYAQMGKIDLAFEWLEKGYKNHEIEMYWLKVEPPFEPLHSDPRWQAMLDKVGFPD